MAIVTKAELKSLLGLSSSITTDEQAVLDLVHPQAHSALKSFIGYNPEQTTATELYPRRDSPGALTRSELVTTNPQHTRAIREVTLTFSKLQLERLPVRSIQTVKVDSSARYGKASGAFGSGTEWTEGDEFTAEYDSDGLCRSGILVAIGAWPSMSGTVEVRYTAGYTQAELDGGSALNPDPSALKWAVQIAAVKAFNTWQQWKKKAAAGFTSGPLQSEKLGDYSYQLASAGGGAGSGTGTGFVVALPSEARELAGPFVNWGLQRL